jgi:chaperonin cofactor prefoldin
MPNDVVSGGGPAMTLTEEQRAAICAVSGLLTAIGCPQCHSYLQKNYAHHIEVLRAMVDSSGTVGPSGGFDLEKARASIAHYRIENPSNVDTESALKELVDQANLAEDALAEIERLRADNDDLKEVLNRIGDFLEKSGNFDEYPAVGLSVESALRRQAARIQELEDAHKRSGVKYAKIINELRSSVYANTPGLDVGKIGLDDSKKISHLRPYEVVAADLAGMLAKSWQITEERMRAIRLSEELAWDCKVVDVLRAMLEEAL